METTNEPCPKCQEVGRDTRGDNLVRYASDGHAHCFACSYHEFVGGHVGFLKDAAAKYASNDAKVVPQLPADATPIIDYIALQWLTKYEISLAEVKQYKMLWSKSRQMLIFPLFNSLDVRGEARTQEGGPMVAWQGRSWNPNYRMKYYNVGEFANNFPILNIMGGKGTDIIIVEDFISAIKIARRYTAMPLFGAELTASRMKKLENLAEDLTFWLDEDKADKGMQLCRTASMLGFRAKFVLTKHDPKEYNDEQIRDALETN